MLTLERRYATLRWRTLGAAARRHGDGEGWILVGSEKEEDAERVARQATTYNIKDGEFYRRRPNDVSLRCIPREQGKELLAYIHGGDCGHHSSHGPSSAMRFTVGSTGLRHSMTRSSW